MAFGTDTAAFKLIECQRKNDAKDAEIARLRAELAEAFDRGRAEGRSDVAKYARAIGEIEAVLGIVGAVPMSETVAAVRAVVAARDAAIRERDARPEISPEDAAVYLSRRLTDETWSVRDLVHDALRAHAARASSEPPQVDASVGRFRVRAERADASEVPVLASDEPPQVDAGRCEECGGEEHFNPDGSVWKCPACNGTGRKEVG